MTRSIHIGACGALLLGALVLAPAASAQNPNVSGSYEGFIEMRLDNCDDDLVDDDLFVMRGTIAIEQQSGSDVIAGSGSLEANRFFDSFAMSLVLDGAVDDPGGAISGNYSEEILADDQPFSSGSGTFAGSVSGDVLSFVLTGTDTGVVDGITCDVTGTFEQYSDTVWIEDTDAGDSVAGSQRVEADEATALTRIDGTFEAGEDGSDPVSAGLDVDMYRIQISNPGEFSALVHGAYALDSQVFLFHPDGTGIAGNDDQPGDNFECFFDDCWSLLPAGHEAYNTLSAGEYLIAVTQYDLDPQDASTWIFPDDAMDVAEPEPGSEALELWAIRDEELGDLQDYSISLTGASHVPEPTSGLLQAAALLGIAALKRRSRG